MKTCSYCGRENQDDAACCAECGTTLAVLEGVIDAEASQWILKAFAWALEQFGTDEFYERTVLVTPTPAHFAEQLSAEGDLAAALFARVKAYAGMEDWACELVAQEPDVDPCIAPTIVMENVPSGPAGTFSSSSAEPSPVVITYNPNEIRDPQSLIATFAHELAHYLGYTAEVPPPGGEKNWEYATDLLAVVMGFGIFLANSAVQFSQFSGPATQGWSSRSQGYLSEPELVYTLAIFCVLKGIDRKQVEPHLKWSLHSTYKKAIKELETTPEATAGLRAIRKVTGLGHGN